MYNGLIINDLLLDRKIKKKDLVIAINGKNSTIESVINGNPTVRTLEKVADFFKVSMDIFFEREVSFSKEGHTIGAVNGNGNKVQQGHGNVMLNSQEKEIEHLKALLDEKERLIQVLMSKRE